MSTEMMVVQAQQVDLVRECSGYQALLDLLMRAGEPGKGLLKNIQTPLDALALADAGAAFGMTPLAALRSFHMVEGKPVLAADRMAALCLAHPACMAFYAEESTAERCVYVGRRRQRDGTITEQRIEWTMKRANTAGVAGRPVWKQYPDQMLRARATSELARALFPDAMAGIYTAEEVETAPTPAPSVRTRDEARLSDRGTDRAPAPVEDAEVQPVDRTRLLTLSRAADIAPDALAVYVCSREDGIQPSIEGAAVWLNGKFDAKAWSAYVRSIVPVMTSRCEFVDTITADWWASLGPKRTAAMVKGCERLGLEPSAAIGIDSVAYGLALMLLGVEE